ncbi:cupin domain-containing protein [Bifidobacterium miconisargentati]|uniref:cupin domain-containing protein n=1 Tax=Bifidobacterium miconisargentati TaxID=2834437 RepID=UPI001BDC78CD|nr:cupin domain-containing protein [Bifidobacterium miconisargentati]MBW3089606.1 cupin domain-containing protein [Bifidobacterium miconisargentati]
MSVPLEEMSPYARSVVQRLGLEAHPEGGWYTRDWQSPLPEPDSGRPLASLIYFLLPEGDASAWHKVDADEIWLWHGPATVTLELGGDGEQPADDPSERRAIVLGNGIAPESQAEEHGQSQDGAPVGHAIVPAGVWQRTVPGHGDALVSCVVSPGFTFEGFTLQ